MQSEDHENTILVPSGDRESEIRYVTHRHMALGFNQNIREETVFTEKRHHRCLEWKASS